MGVVVRWPHGIYTCNFCSLSETRMHGHSQVMLKTERLCFETWTSDDFALLNDLHGDLRVQLSYAPGSHKWTKEGIERRLFGYIEEQAKFGFTKWKLSLPNGTFIGRAGWSPYVEASLAIGYAIKPEFWSNGYASEAAIALMNWAQARWPNESFVGFALPHNQHSLRILEKIGMTFRDYRQIAGAEFAFYEFKRPEPTV
jgi:[ribosomal protein S5]-alanine N-acetyltransferase